MDDKKNITVRVTPDLHQKLKIHVTLANTTVQDYVVSLIEEDLKKNAKELNV